MNDDIAAHIAMFKALEMALDAALAAVSDQGVRDVIERHCPPGVNCRVSPTSLEALAIRTRQQLEAVREVRERLERQGPAKPPKPSKRSLR